MTEKHYIADLHIHSRYSRATSKASTLHGLAAWAAIKGISVVGTGDFTHPGWFAHINKHLEPAEPGFFRLRRPSDPAALADILPPGVQPDTSSIRFVLSSEISSIYKRGGRVRKVHNILFAPDLASVRRINTTLAGIGNLESDGRPILGLDSRTLLEILLEHAPQGFFVPAHIWTPWFSLFGSKSGFDSIEECFDDLSDQIFALETGLSSDPEMNRHISALDRFTLISNSDCHSPSKLGREANVFATGFDFFALQEALRNPRDKEGRQRFAATIEFYPEEGKYHCDGHRKCGICLEPDQTVRAKGICPECGRPLTIGVLYRVMELADRSSPVYPPGAPAVHSLVPLPELLGEMYGCGPATKKVAGVYGKLINTFGSEFSLLLKTPLTDIAEVSPTLAEAVHRVRENRVIRQPGFDGEFGVIKVFSEQERAGLGGQLNLFGVKPAKPRKKRPAKKKVFRAIDGTGLKKRVNELNDQQKAVVESSSRRILVTAGPGTGKTHTLVQRVVRLLEQELQPMTVITFTNKAVQEIRERVDHLAARPELVRVATFHSYALEVLRKKEPDLQPAGPEMRTRMLQQIFPDMTEAQRREISREIGLFLSAAAVLPDTFPRRLEPFFTALAGNGLLELDAVVPACTRLLNDDREFADVVAAAAGHLFVDEFQDLNGSQYELVRILSRSCPVFAIGDPDQAIYGFRGSSPAWFHRFREELQPQRFFLRLNYRNGSRILAAASTVIAKNHPAEQGATPEAAKGNSGGIYWTVVADPGAEARFVAEQIQHLIGGTSHREIDRLGQAGSPGLALSDIAVLYRTGRQAREVAHALAERTIPFQVVDVQPFYQSGDAKTFFYWILLAAEMADKAELLFLLGREKGLGQQALAAVDALLAPSRGDLLAELEQKKSVLEQRVRTTVAEFCRLGRRFQQTVAEKSLPAGLELLLHRYGADPEEDELQRLLQLAGLAESLSAFAVHLRQYQNSVIYDERAESVLLATLHASKGLEFKAVFIIGCEEGLLPLEPRGSLDPEGLQEHEREERRLFYVGMTRAEESLYLSAAKTRPGYGGKATGRPSSFVTDIPSRLLADPPKIAAGRKKKTHFAQLRLF